MDFRRLKYFVVVAEERHITRAAERLGMQQPPLSQQIKLLEEELQTQLFWRTRKGVELTDAGRSLYEDAVRILGDLDRAASKAIRTARGEQGRIVFGFTHATAFHETMLKSLSAFHDAFPKIELSIVEATTGELVQELKAATVDVAIVRSHIAERSELQIYELEDEPLFVAVPSTHRLAEDPGPIDLAELANEPLVLYRRATSPGLYDAIIGAFRALKLTPWVAQESSNLIASVNLVSAGFGLTIVPHSITAMRLRDVRYRQIGRPAGLFAPLRLACAKGGISEASRRLVAHIRHDFRHSAKAS